MLKILKKASWLAMGIAVTLLVAAGSSSAQVKGNTIIFGAAVSFTGKYSTAGRHTKNGYELAVKRINEMGGVSVGGKKYQIKSPALGFCWTLD